MEPSHANEVAPPRVLDALNPSSDRPVVMPAAAKGVNGGRADQPVVVDPFMAFFQSPTLTVPVLPPDGSNGTNGTNGNNGSNGSATHRPANPADADRTAPSGEVQVLPEASSGPITAPAAGGSSAASISPGVAFRRHRILALLPIVALVAGAVAIGVQRTPKQAAETRLIVGTINVQALAVPGYVTATIQLASTYSRLGVSQAVMGPAAKQAGVSVEQLLKDVVVTPIPQDAFISVTAQNVSRVRALAESNAVATSLQRYVATLSSSYYSPAGIVSRYHKASSTLERYNGQIALLQDQLALETSAKARQATEAKIVTASRKADSARLTFNGYAAAYNTLLQGNRQPQGLKVVGSAVITGDDRGKFIERGAAAALVVGAILGLALATLRERRVRRRRGVA
jgi:hypothetical protein